MSKMSKLKNVLLVATSWVLVAAIAVAGTLAYLQDDDSDVNVMTLGSVSIVQHEYQRATKEDGAYEIASYDGVESYVLEGFTQGKALLPIVGDPSTGAAGWDTTVVRMTQVDSYGSMQVFAGKNAQDKFVTVENTGKTDAYVRTLVAIEVGDSDKDLIGTSYHSTWSSNPVGIIEIDGNNYYLTEYIYAGGLLSDGSWRHGNGILPAGDTSYPSLSQVYIKSSATNEDMEKIDGNGNGTLDILVLSQAVQAGGFADAQTALDTAFGDITTTNHPWANIIIASEVGISEAGTYVLNGDVYTIDSAYFHTQNASGPVTIDGNGATVEGIATYVPDWQGGTIPEGGAVFASTNGSLVTVNNLTFTGANQMIMSGFYSGATSSSNFNAEYNNVNIVDIEATGSVNYVYFAMTVYGKAVMNNCTVNGTTISSVCDDSETAEVYDIAVVNGAKLIANKSSFGSIYTGKAGTSNYWGKAYVELNNSTADTIYACGRTNGGATVINSGSYVKEIIANNSTGISLTVAEGATVDVLDLSNITGAANKSTITINGTVNKIVDNGVTYNSIDDWKNAQ